MCACMPLVAPSKHLVCCQYCRFYNASALVATITHFHCRGGNLVIVLAIGGEGGLGGCYRPNGWQHLFAMVQIRVKSLLTGIAVVAASTSTSISTFLAHFIVNAVVVLAVVVVVAIVFDFDFVAAIVFPWLTVVCYICCCYCCWHFPISLARLLAIHFYCLVCLYFARRCSSVFV